MCSSTGYSIPLVLVNAIQYKQFYIEHDIVHDLISLCFARFHFFFNIEPGSSVTRINDSGKQLHFVYSCIVYNTIFCYLHFDSQFHANINIIHMKFCFKIDYILLYYMLCQRDMLFKQKVYKT